MPVGRLHEGEGSYHSRGLPYGGKIDQKMIDDGGDVTIERFVRAMYFPPFEGAVVDGENGVRHVCDTWSDYLRVREDMENAKK